MNRITLSAFFILVGSAALLSVGCARNEAAVPNPNTPVSVTTIRAEIKPHAEQHRVSGLVSAEEEAVLSFKTGGVIESIRKEAGDPIRRGEVLALLDTTEIGAMVTDAAQTAALAASNFERIRTLHAANVATDQQLEAAKAGHERADAGLRRARFNLEHSVLRAPFDGTINMKLSNPGEIVGPGQPVLRVLNSSSGRAMSVKVTVPAELLPALHTGDSVAVLLERGTGRLWGTIDKVAHSAEPGSGGFQVKVNLPAAPELHPGLVATLLLTGAEKPMIALPAVALSSMDRDRGYVYIVMEGHAARWPVNILRIANDAILVEPTLPEGSQVITSGAAYVSDGHPVTVVEVLP